MLAAAVLLVSRASVPPPQCVKAMDDWCSNPFNCPVKPSSGAKARYALNDTEHLGKQAEWRCYDPSTLNADHTKYESGSNFCTRDQELRDCLQACLAGKPCEWPQPPKPAPPKPQSGLSAVQVFWPGENTSAGDVYPCIRIPSILLAGDKRLLAFAECRRTIGDGCLPKGGTDAPGAHRDLCMKKSDNGGETWSDLSVVSRDCWQPDPVWDSVTGTVVLNMNCGGKGISVAFSADKGDTWTAAKQIDQDFGPAAQSAVGPGVGLQLSATNPHAPGRLLFIGHHGYYVEDFVWYSDDHGHTYKLANSSLKLMNEAQMVELSNGDVVANMRNRHASKCDCRAVSVSKDGGSSWSDPTYDDALTSPVCQASVISANSSIYFSNPASKTSRVSGVVRRSTDDGKTWGSTLQVSSSSQGFAYSCLTRVPQPGKVGLLWETDCDGCTGPSCCSVFSLVPQDF
eukprot:TRINITY_DN2700_c0_g1_i2.p2 TRINITY_DN2700_c0_g1~~TRINITY_DN2700_c0_g1_i2.p2  ORF type:complete len:456 (+),score=138.13 TRINITY_DN2700_c0_g1_i2:65-1432(+)